MKAVEERYAPFVREIEAAAGRYRAADVFVDACHMMALSVWAQLCFGEARRRAEEDYAATRAKYGEGEFAHLCEAFAALVAALEERREEFLGHVMERCFGVTNKGNGQFLTPVNLSHMMGRIVAPEPREEVVRLCDPCCGAGVLVIEGAEAFVERGWAQRNVCVVAIDIDGRACDMCYVQLSLLGYAGVVQQLDALSMKAYGDARYTPGWFLHGFPMRGVAA